LEIPLAPTLEALLDQCLFLDLFLLRQRLSVVDDLLGSLSLLLQIFWGVLRPCLAYRSGDLIQFLEMESTSRELSGVLQTHLERGKFPFLQFRKLRWEELEVIS